MRYKLIDGADQMKAEDVHALLKNTYWAGRRTLAQIETSMRNSACFGIWLEDEGKLAGFARVITDYATTYYLCDVVIDENCRRRGLGSALVSHIVSRPEFAALRGFLFTKDAHGLYAKFGFETVDGRAMVRQPEG